MCWAIGPTSRRSVLVNRRGRHEPVALQAGTVREGDPLTAQELEVLALVAAGESTPAISRRLGIAEKTVKTHLTSVYRKTGSANRVQAARYYLDNHPAPARRA